MEERETVEGEWRSGKPLEGVWRGTGNRQGEKGAFARMGEGDLVKGKIFSLH